MVLRPGQPRRYKADRLQYMNDRCWTRWRGNELCERLGYRRDRRAPSATPSGTLDRADRAARADIRRQRVAYLEGMHRQRLRVVGRQVRRPRSSACWRRSPEPAHAVAVVNGTAALHACFSLPASSRRRGDRPGADVHRDHERRDRLLRGDAAFRRQRVRHARAWIPRARAPISTAIAERAPGRSVQPRDRPADRGARCRCTPSAIRSTWTASAPSARDCRHTGGRGRRGVARLAPTRARGIGSQTHIGALSFNGNKIVTTGGGGAILTNDAELGAPRQAHHDHRQAAARWAFVHDEVGYNYRLPNLNAALGCAQLEQLPASSPRKRAARGTLSAQPSTGMAGLRVRRASRRTDGSNYWLNAILLDDDSVRDCATTCWPRYNAAGLRHAAGLDADAPSSDVSRLPARRSRGRRIDRAPADQPCRRSAS